MAEDNYKKVIENWRQKFLEMDHDELIRRFGLKSDPQALYITYYSREFRVDRKTGRVSCASGTEELPFNTIITFYNMFHYAQESPKASGKMVPFRDVKRVYPFEQAYRNTILKGLETSFAGRVPELKKACEKLHGSKLPQGDAGYLLPVFPFLSIAVLFWDQDDEFSAQANMLFDSNITDFMHEENVVGIASDALYYLQLEAGQMEQAAFGGMA